jgi:hypothetical protein
MSFIERGKDILDHISDVEEKTVITGKNKNSNMKKEYEISRRNRVDLFTPAESAIYQAQQAVEMAGASLKLTEATILLSKARNAVADHVDGIEGETYPREVKREDSILDRLKNAPFGYNLTEEERKILIKETEKDRQSLTWQAGQIQGLIKENDNLIIEKKILFEKLEEKNRTITGLDTNISEVNEKNSILLSKIERMKETLRKTEWFINRYDKDNVILLKTIDDILNSQLEMEHTLKDEYKQFNETLLNKLSDKNNYINELLAENKRLKDEIIKIQQDKKEQCLHPEIHSMSGGFYIGCSVCRAEWVRNKGGTSNEVDMSKASENIGYQQWKNASIPDAKPQSEDYTDTPGHIGVMI